MTFFVSVVEAEKGNACGDIITSRSPDIVDVDADHKDPHLCSTYAPDIYSNLRVAEVCATNIFLVFRVGLNHIHHELYFSMCSVYLNESLILIFNPLVLLPQLARRPFPNFMETIQRDITQSMRGILVDWLVEVRTVLLFVRLICICIVSGMAVYWGNHIKLFCHFYHVSNFSLI